MRNLIYCVLLMFLHFDGNAQGDKFQIGLDILGPIRNLPFGDFYEPIPKNPDTVFILNGVDFVPRSSFQMKFALGRNYWLRTTLGVLYRREFDEALSDFDEQLEHRRRGGYIGLGVEKKFIQKRVHPIIGAELTYYGTNYWYGLNMERLPEEQVTPFNEIRSSFTWHEWRVGGNLFAAAEIKLYKGLVLVPEAKIWITRLRSEVKGQTYTYNETTGMFNENLIGTGLQTRWLFELYPLALINLNYQF